MTTATWRLLDDGSRDGARNMALDGALHRLAEERLAAGEPVVPTLRLYRWSPAAVSIGRHQEPDAACDLDACRVEGIDVVRRATGGRAVLHDDELTYSIIAPATGAFAGAGVSAASAAISRALVDGLRRLGLDVATERSVARHSPRERRVACFASASRCEVTASGRKLLGSAQARGRRAFLQHGSLPLTFDVARHARVLGCAPESLEGKATGLVEQLGRRPGDEELARALVEGVASVLSVAVEPGPLDAEEEDRVRAFDETLRSDPSSWRPARPEAA